MEGVIICVENPLQFLLLCDTCQKSDMSLSDIFALKMKIAKT